MAQTLTKRPEEPLHWDRSLRFTAIGFGVIGPLLHHWWVRALEACGREPAAIP